MKHLVSQREALQAVRDAPQLRVNQEDSHACVHQGARQHHRRKALAWVCQRLELRLEVPADLQQACRYQGLSFGGCSAPPPHKLVCRGQEILEMQAAHPELLLWQSVQRSAHALPDCTFSAVEAAKKGASQPQDSLVTCT